MSVNVREGVGLCEISDRAELKSCARSAFHVNHAGGFVLRSVRGLQVPPQPHKERYGYAHHHQRAHAKDQEPPDHPHNALG
jgi:hypothetical protein